MWTLHNDLDLIFVCAYQRILQLSYVEELLEQVKKAFLKGYEESVKAVVWSAKGKDVLTSGHPAAGALFGPEGWTGLFKGWEETFSKILRDLELGAAKVSRRRAEPEERRVCGMR